MLPRPALLTVAAAALLVPSSASAQSPTTTTLTQLYVAPTGSDTNSGTSGSPLRTVSAALKRSAGGQTITVRPGYYPQVVDQRARTKPVVVTGTLDAHIAGARLQGSQNVRWDGVKFTGKVEISQHGVYKSSQPSRNLLFQDVEITSPNTTAVSIRGAFNVFIRNSHIHDAGTGIGGPANVERSSGIYITDNLIERLKGDGIQFGEWHNVSIERNTIQDVSDPANVVHNDAIQLTGDSIGVVIRGNKLHRSADQLLLIQNAFGPLDDILVQENVIAGSGAYAIQSQGATRTRFIRNTVWYSRWGGLLLRAGRSGVIATDTVVQGNILSALNIIEGARAAVNVDNWVPCKTTAVTISAPCANPGFVDAAAYDFRIAVESPLYAKVASIGAVS
jgi:hypothetical protein